jgi:hypothetical protein
VLRSNSSAILQAGDSFYLELGVDNACYNRISFSCSALDSQLPADAKSSFRRTFTLSLLDTVLQTLNLHAAPLVSEVDAKILSSCVSDSILLPRSTSTLASSCTSKDQDFLSSASLALTGPINLQVFILVCAIFWNASIESCAYCYFLRILKIFYHYYYLERKQGESKQYLLPTMYSLLFNFKI